MLLICLFISSITFSPSIGLLRGQVAKGAEAAVHLYLGSSAAAAPLSQAVSTRSAPTGAWIENDQARLLLGQEGAHLYRWEVKRADNRDLTEPGEGGWAGFSDMATHRAARYRLVCLSRGPALVRFECTAPSAQTKIINLYAGVSWVEVLLSEPTPIYWDFDHPGNFAADGPTPGTYLFSNGATGPVGKQADGVPAQVKQRDVYWGIKFNPDKLALGIITPETAAFHHVAPGSGAGGVGIESSPPAGHFVTFAGLLEHEPAQTMERLRQTLDLRHQPEVVLHGLQRR